MIASTITCGGSIYTIHTSMCIKTNNRSLLIIPYIVIVSYWLGLHEINQVGQSENIRSWKTVRIIIVHTTPNFLSWQVDMRINTPDTVERWRCQLYDVFIPTHWNCSGKIQQQMCNASPENWTVATNIALNLNIRFRDIRYTNSQTLDQRSCFRTPCTVISWNLTLYDHWQDSLLIFCFLFILLNFFHKPSYQTLWSHCSLEKIQCKPCYTILSLSGLHITQTNQNLPCVHASRLILACTQTYTNSIYIDRHTVRCIVFVTHLGWWTISKIPKQPMQ